MRQACLQTQVNTERMPGCCRRWCSGDADMQYCPRFRAICRSKMPKKFLLLPDFSR
jgi:hypothetical protein